MGCDIHSFAEVRKNGKWEKVGEHFELDDFGKEYEKREKTECPFDWRSYSMFAFLAGVRNYDHCEPISEPKGLPKNSEFLNSLTADEGYGAISQYEHIMDWDYHSHSFLTLEELLDFDYDRSFWNRRITRIIYREDGSVAGSNGACIAEEGEGRIVTYRENLGEHFFKVIEELKQLGNPEDVRVVFWFDN